MRLHPAEVAPAGATAFSVQVAQLEGAQGSTLKALNAIDVQQDWLAEEVPVALIFNGISHAVMLATPTDLEDFALGFALTEGLLQSPRDLYAVERHDTAQGIALQLEVSAQCEWGLKQRRRTLAGRTGCGLCGAESLQQVRQDIQSVQAVSVPVSAILRAAQCLREWQYLQQLTGATHAAAWADLDGNILRVREDVGRHNALDKLIGDLARHAVSPQSGFVLVTSRASFEMVQKAAVWGAGVLAAVSAPTAMAVQLAQSCNLALAGYVRDQRLVAYSFAQRFDRMQGRSTGVEA